MARIRSIKPEIRESKVVTSWPWEVRYFWVLLWGYLDDHGRGADLPKRIAGDCYPLDDVSVDDVDNWLELMTKGVGGKPGPLCRYEANGNRYIHAVNWSEHQKPNRPGKTRIPDCPFHEGLTEPLTDCEHTPSLPGAAEQQSRGAEEQQQNARESLTEVPSGAEQAGRIVIDATSVDEATAAEVVLAIWRERRPRNLAGLVRSLANQNDLGEWIVKAQRSIAARASVTTGPPRASPVDCPHGNPDGLELLGSTGLPRCPHCRQEARARGHTA